VRTRRRSALGAVLVGASLLAAVTACSAGQITQTDTQVASVPGSNINSVDGNIALRNGVVAYAPRYKPNTEIPLELRFFNSSEQAAKLTGATATDGTGSVRLLGGPAPTPPPVVVPPAAPTSATPSGTRSPAGTVPPSTTPTEPSSPPAPPSPTQDGSSTFSIDVPRDGYQIVEKGGAGGYLALVGRSGELVAGNTVGVTFTFSYADGSTTTLKADLPVGIPLTAPARSTPSAGAE
jgi:hypothetical protein